MTWEQKAQAIQSLVGWYKFNIKLREPGNWYIDVPVEIAKDGMLEGYAGGGTTPETAVENWWKHHVDALPLEACLRARPELGSEWRGRWNGFMWEEKR